MGSGFRPEKEIIANGLSLLSGPKTAGGIALAALLSAGTIDDRQHAAELAYGRLRRRFDRSGVWHGIPHEAWQAVKRDHAALIRAAGAERFMLDRLYLDGDAPLSSEVERVKVALGRMAEAGKPQPIVRGSGS